MKILLISDSHGYTHNIINAVRDHASIDMIIHLGDFVTDILKISSMYQDYQYEYVRGNNDWSREIENEKLLQISGKKIFITHGHLYNVKTNYEKLKLKGKLIGADAIFFGHTHVAEEIFSEGLILLNPGSISFPLKSNTSTCCIVEIKDGKINSRFLGYA